MQKGFGRCAVALTSLQAKQVRARSLWVRSACSPGFQGKQRLCERWWSAIQAAGAEHVHEGRVRVLAGRSSLHEGLFGRFSSYCLL